MLFRLSFKNSNRIISVLTRRLVSTSSRNNDTVSANVCAKTKVDKNWVSYGYEYNSKEADRTAMHSIMFASVTLCLVVGGFFFAYMPDYSLRDWAQREAFLELRRREQKGLPLIDPNFINPSQMHLPSDSEIGDMEIIV
ncbi:unnamed protein product [Psylliodes chrysocephalus]|uniref:NADH dehydrogenase [ubiquinone] 1 beta subcomplex subunit 11, mitochondrial n=1 Tax=Psylliodes chrysocephalus TaxID=3402493 RepID=A0A9P0CDV6_9CUCU|nr:unnamed protein product [Psylliodes chrysocephala]